MYVFQKCYLEINQKKIEDFCLQQENSCFIFKGQNDKECFFLKDLSFLNESVENRKWEFECRKCQKKISIIHEKDKSLEEKKLMLEKLMENGLQINDDTKEDSQDSMFQIEQTFNNSVLYQFEDTILNSKNDSSEQDNKLVKAISSLRFRPEDLIEDKGIEDLKTRPCLVDSQQFLQLLKPKEISQQQEEIEDNLSRRTQQQLDCSIHMIQEEKIQENPNNYFTSNQETEAIQSKQNFLSSNVIILEKKSKTKKQKKKDKKKKEEEEQQENGYPQPIRDISDKFKIYENPSSKKKLAKINNFYDILQNRVQYNKDNLELQIHSQPYLHNRFSSGGTNNKIIFYSNKTDMNSFTFTKDQETEGVQIQDVTIQKILKFNQQIGIYAIKNYSKKTINQLYQDYQQNQKSKDQNLQNQKLDGFYFTKDMQFLMNEYLQWQFSEDIHFQLFQKFFLLYKEAIHCFKELILQYFSYKNFDLKINEFLVFSAQIFQEEIENLKQSFITMIRSFINLTSEEILVNTALNYQILEFVLKKNNINFLGEQLKTSFDYIEKLLQKLKEIIFSDLNYIDNKIEELLNELKQQIKNFKTFYLQQILYKILLNLIYLFFKQFYPTKHN